MEPSEYSAGRNSPDKVNQDLPHQISNPHSSSSSLRKRPRSPTKSPSWFPETPHRRLRFINSPPPVIFTHSNIKAGDGSSLAVELVDAATGRRDTSGPLSSLGLEIVVLDADFTHESWTVSEFNDFIFKEREGKQPLLFGDWIVTLKDGFGVIENIYFADNSSFLKGQRFRLGARAIFEGPTEAKTEAFECVDSVKENLYPGSGKHHPPLLGSEVWRLEGIPENGVEASRLAEEGILTVKDLRRCIARDPDALHGILGRCVSRKALERIVSHAMHCDLDDEVEFYAYDAQAEGVFLLFNSVYNLVQVSFDGVTSLRSELLTSNQKGFTDKLKHEAYENVDRFVPVYRAGFVDQDRPLWGSNYVEPDFSASGSESSQEDSSEIFPPDPSRVSSDKYDVIIRYNKRDISNGFISHLLAALCQKGISATGASIFKRPDGVPECRVVITFLTHRWVSYNLVEFCERLPSKELGVSQIFYRVSPSNLISNTKKLERFPLQHQKSMWWNVLQQGAQMSDYILTDKSDPELMHEIVKDVSKVLLSSDKEKMIGIDSQVEEILSLLRIESPDVRSIGLWGTAGIGKTAIAEKIFRRISVQYKTCVFFKDLHEEVEEKGQVTVAEEFLSKLLEVEPPVLKISDINTCFLRSRLQCKKILVILDDVHDFKDVQTFLGNLNYFGPGSRVIITSRNRRVCVQSKIDHIYEVKPLDIPTALLLLLESGKLKSFKSKLTDDFRKQSLELVKFANGNPEVLQYMRSRPQEEWDLLSQEVLQSSPICIPRILRSCYGLDENEINILLDIACFFRRMDKDDVAMLLDGCGFFAQVGFRSLVDKSLLTIPHNTVDMYRYIQATGREIVRQESPNEPGKRSRLWNAEEVVDVFLNDSGTSAIEGIFLDMSKKVFDGNPNTFEKIMNLRLLKFYCSEVIKKSGVSLRQGLEYLPNKLRLLHWEYYPLSALPRSFDPKNLVELNLPNSCAKQLWKGKKSLEKLRKMRLSYSYQLTKIPRLSNAPNLEHIDLEGCSSLASISQSISSLKKLVFLNLKDCSKLESVPSTVDLESLEVLNISGCSKLETLPEISPNVKELFMGATMIQEIPSSIKNLVSLEKLDLENSTHLVNLPTSICKLKHLETLNLSGCSSLERFPDLSRRMKCLRFLDLSRTAIREIPSSISYLTALEELRFVNCVNLVRLPENLWSLRFKVEFRQIDTEKFSRLWNRFGWLKKVQIS